MLVLEWMHASYRDCGQVSATGVLQEAAGQASLQMTEEEFREHMAWLELKFRFKFNIAKTEHRALSLSQFHGLHQKLANMTH